MFNVLFWYKRKELDKSNILNYQQDENKLPGFSCQIR